MFTEQGVGSLCAVCMSREKSGRKGTEIHSQGSNHVGASKLW